jgi:tetratricopeptide (TPR) repeat protein
LDLAAGKPSEARAAFDRALGKKGRNATTISAALGKAEVELLSGDPAAAVAQSQDALNMATFLQGGVPYSNHAGLAWLMLGRALQARGDIKQARKAYEMAITHLSNTVDADHPELLRARQLLASSGGGGAA